MHILRTTCILTPHLIWQTLIIANGKPILATVRCPSLQDRMKLLDKILSQSLVCMVNDVVYTTEMINSLDDIIHIDGAVCDANSVRLKDILRLVMCQFAALDMIGVVSQILFSLYFNAKEKLIGI